MTDALAPDAALTILIVDDSAMMRSLLKRAAQASGAVIGRVLEATNGREALDVLGANDVHALFTDLNMPEMGGADLLRNVRQRREWDRLLRVVVSTDGTTERRLELSALGVRCCIEKPFRPEIIRDLLGELVASR
ncbi:MAG: response regulator [Vicinamibacterales bacterium]